MYICMCLSTCTMQLFLINIFIYALITRARQFFSPFYLRKFSIVVLIVFANRTYACICIQMCMCVKFKILSVHFLLHLTF